MAAITTLSLADDPAFLQAQELVRGALCAGLGDEWSKVVDLLSAGKSLDLRGDFELMVQLENCIMRLLSGFGSEDINAVQFPVNVRVSHASPPQDYLARPFATDYLHCDVWSGAPADSSNAFLYLFAVGNCSRLKLYQSIESDAYASGYRGPYSGFKADPGLLHEVPTSAAIGTMHLFSTYCPHQTVRGSDGLRISIDFRVRTGVPYLIDGVAVSDAEFSSYSPGVPGQGIYWTKPVMPLRSFADKCAFEMDRARELGAWAVALREAYIRRITTKGVFA